MSIETKEKENLDYPDKDLSWTQSKNYTEINDSESVDKVIDTIKSEDEVLIEVYSSKPEDYPLPYCNFRINPDNFSTEQQAMDYVESYIKSQYRSIVEFNPDVKEIKWCISGDQDFHFIGLDSMKDRSVL